MDYDFLDINLRVDELQEQLIWNTATDELSSQASKVLGDLDINNLRPEFFGATELYYAAQILKDTNAERSGLNMMLLLNSFTRFLKAAFEVGAHSDFSAKFIEEVFAFLSRNSVQRGMGVVDAFEEIKTKKLLRKNIALLKELRLLLIRNGDIELFLNNNLANAIRCYRAADIYEYVNYENDGNELYFTKAEEWTEIYSWHKFVQAFKPEKLGSCLQVYIRPVNEDLLAAAYKKRNDKNSNLRFQLDINGRHLQGCYLAYYARSSISIIANFHGDDGQFPKVLKLFELNRGIAYQEVFEELDKHDIAEKKLYLSKITVVIEIVERIKSVLKIRNLSDDPLYYTSLRTLSYMLPEACQDDKDRCGKLSIMHVSYMNDPIEGRVLYRRLGNEKLINDSADGRTVVNMPYVFMKCFTNQIDYLPMWDIYGDHAQGCCIVLDRKRFLDSENSRELYRVCYIDSNNKVTDVANPAIVDEDINELEKQLKELEKYVNKFSGCELKPLKACLSEIVYLFKDSSYSYEQEIRIIRTYNNKDEVFQHTKSEDSVINSPLLFVYSSKPIQIKEVILGPKFPSLESRLPYLQEQLEKMAEITDTEIPRITKSSIHYR